MKSLLKMAFSVQFGPQASKFIKKLDSNTKERIKAKVQRLCIDPFHHAVQGFRLFSLCQHYREIVLWPVCAVENLDQFYPCGRNADSQHPKKSVFSHWIADFVFKVFFRHLFQPLTNRNC